MIIGTPNFTSRAAAVRYYRDYGYEPYEVDLKISEGEIHIGRPTPGPGESIVLIDGGRRYAVETPCTT